MIVGDCGVGVSVYVWKVLVRGTCEGCVCQLPLSVYVWRVLVRAVSVCM